MVSFTLLGFLPFFTLGYMFDVAVLIHGIPNDTQEIFMPEPYDPYSPLVRCNFLPRHSFWCEPPEGVGSLFSVLFIFFLLICLIVFPVGQVLIIIH